MNLWREKVPYGLRERKISREPAHPRSLISLSLWLLECMSTEIPKYENLKLDWFAQMQSEFSSCTVKGQK